MEKTISVWAFFLVKNVKLLIYLTCLVFHQALSMVSIDLVPLLVKTYPQLYLHVSDHTSTTQNIETSHLFNDIHL